MSKINLELIAFTVALNLAGCASIRVGQQVQSGEWCIRQPVRPSAFLIGIANVFGTLASFCHNHTSNHNSARSNHR